MSAIETKPVCDTCEETDPCLCETRRCDLCDAPNVPVDADDVALCDPCQDDRSHTEEERREAATLHRMCDGPTDGLIHLPRTSPTAGV